MVSVDAGKGKPALCSTQGGNQPSNQFLGSGGGIFEKKPVLILDFSQPPAAATGRNFCTRLVVK
jgi:hypothetical protein